MKNNNSKLFWNAPRSACHWPSWAMSASGYKPIFSNAWDYVRFRRISRHSFWSPKFRHEFEYVDPDCEQQKITLAFFKLTGPKPDHFGLKIRVSVVQIRPRAPFFQAPGTKRFPGLLVWGNGFAPNRNGKAPCHRILSVTIIVIWVFLVASHKIEL